MITQYNIKTPSVNYILDKIVFMKDSPFHSITTQIKKDCITAISYGLPDLLNDVMNEAVANNDSKAMAVFSDIGAHQTLNLKDFTLKELNTLLQEEVKSFEHHKIYSNIKNILGEIKSFGQEYYQKSIDNLIQFAVDNDETKALDVLVYFPHSPSLDEHFIKRFIKTKNLYCLHYLIKSDNIDLSKYTLITHEVFAATNKVMTKGFDFDDSLTLKEINDQFKDNLKDNNFCNYLTYQNIYRLEKYYPETVLPSVKFIPLVKPVEIIPEVPVLPIKPIKEVEAVVIKITEELPATQPEEVKLPKEAKVSDKLPPRTIRSFGGEILTKKELQKIWDTILLTEYFLNDEKKPMSLILHKFFIDNKISSGQLLRNDISLMRLPISGHTSQKNIHAKDFVRHYIPELHQLINGREADSVLNNITPFLNKINKDKMYTYKNSVIVANKTGKIKLVI